MQSAHKLLMPALLCLLAASHLALLAGEPPLAPAPAAAAAEATPEAKQDSPAVEHGTTPPLTQEVGNAAEAPPATAPAPDDPVTAAFLELRAALETEIGPGAFTAADWAAAMQAMVAAFGRGLQLETAGGQAETGHPEAADLQADPLGADALLLRIPGIFVEAAAAATDAIAAAGKLQGLAVDLRGIGTGDAAGLEALAQALAASALPLAVRADGGTAGMAEELIRRLRQAGMDLVVVGRPTAGRAPGYKRRELPAGLVLLVPEPAAGADGTTANFSAIAPDITISANTADDKVLRMIQDLFTAIRAFETPADIAPRPPGAPEQEDLIFEDPPEVDTPMIPEQTPP